MSESAQGPAQAYGFTLGRVDLLLDPADDAQYVADATVYPLFLAPAGVLGLIQVRGQPVPVLDADPQPQRLAQRPNHVQVLVVGGGFDAGALRVEHPPQAVALAPGETSAAPPRPECAFANALREPERDSGGRWWWRFDAPQLFRALAVD